MMTFRFSIYHTLFALYLLTLGFTHTAFAMEENPYPFTSISETKRFESLTKEIRCVVCQNQSIADSNAPLAHDLREKVYHLVKDHKSDGEIKNYLVSRYGEFILLRPRFNKTTVMLWVFPFIMLGSIFTVLLYRTRKAGVKMQS